MNEQMSSMKFSAKEIDSLLKIDPAGPVIKRLREADTQDINLDRSSPAQVHFIAKEVLKACNVIRPSVTDLATLPKARAEAKKAIKSEQKNRKTFNSSISTSLRFARYRDKSLIEVKSVEYALDAQDDDEVRQHENFI